MIHTGRDCAARQTLLPHRHKTGVPDFDTQLLHVW